MTIRRLASLQLVLLGGLSLAFLLPKDIKLQPVGIELMLPEFVGDWHGVDQEASKGERDILGPDTQFAKKVYTKGTDEIFVSIVVSGPDMNTSIHRPERCLPAQGWTVADSRVVAIALPSSTLKATRLQNIRNVTLSDGQPFKLRSLSYYWFVGHSQVTASHLQRTWIDIRDRVLKGRNQQWAYVTIASTITKDFRVFGTDEKETDDLIRAFTSNLVPQIEKSPVRPGE
jgi:EpsI family protein